jgi:hypothetical protein
MLGPETKALYLCCGAALCMCVYALHLIEVHNKVMYQILTQCCICLVLSLDLNFSFFLSLSLSLSLSLIPLS